MRPLARTYGPNLKRCKHFVNLLRGQGYGSMSTLARTILMRMFQLDPADRPTLDQIKQDEWYRAPIPSSELLGRIMEEKAHAVWMSQQKPQVHCMAGYVLYLFLLLVLLSLCLFSSLVPTLFH